MHISDLTHVLDKSGAIGPVKGPAHAMAQFLVNVVAHASGATGDNLAATTCFKCKKNAVEAVRAQDDAISVGLPLLPHGGSYFELEGQPMGFEQPPTDPQCLT